MDAERAEKRNYISHYFRVDRERYNDYEMDKLLWLIENGKRFDGKIQRYVGLPQKCYSSEGRYDRQDIKTYTFIYDQDGIRILYHLDTYYDGYKESEENLVFDTGRGLLNNFNWILRELQWIL